MLHKNNVSRETFLCKISPNNPTFSYNQYNQLSDMTPIIFFVCLI